MDKELITSLQAIIDNKNFDSEDMLFKNLKVLRNACINSEIQDLLAAHQEFQAVIEALLFSNYENNRVESMAWQLLANSIVNNTGTQSAIWKRHGVSILEKCTDLSAKSTDIQLMIIYNVYKGSTGLLTDQMVLKTIIKMWQKIVDEKCEENFDFLHFLYEHFIVEEGRRTVGCLMRMNSEERIIFLDYLASYIRHDCPNGSVHSFLLQHISKEFKMKSDCVLRQLNQIVEKSHPREVYALLRIIACASGSETYSELYAKDNALFLNISSLLRCLVAAGKEVTKNMFTPLNKLEEVAPTSMQVSRDFEHEVSYEMKTLLVRSIANLLYKNSVNQGYCLDTQLMPALFECTNMDARNPMIKEWSILAIRNACIGCPEIQEIVANLTKQGVVKNDILDELNLEMGSLRIQPSKAQE